MTNILSAREFVRQKFPVLIDKLSGDFNEENIFGWKLGGEMGSRSVKTCLDSSTQAVEKERKISIYLKERFSSRVGSWLVAIHQKEAALK